MKSIRHNIHRWLLTLVCGLLPFAPAGAVDFSMVPAVPEIAAGSHILVDYHSDHVIASNNAHERMEPASLTKLMTAYTVFHELEKGNIDLDEKVRISEAAWRMPGSRMFVEVNSEVSVEELLKGLIIQSGNDASVALAEHVAGSEDAFAGLMNEHARNLGMDNTRFTNASGLPEDELYTSAHDMAVLAKAVIEHFPDFYSWYSEREYTYNGITQYNRNRLLWRNPHVDGLKTGHTRSAGYGLVTSAERDGMRLISVVMKTAGEEARAQETQKLLNHGFRFYTTHRLYEADTRLTDIRIWKGEKEELALGIEEPLHVTIPRGQYDQLEASMTLEQALMAPASAGESYGTLAITMDDQVLAERPLVALEDVAEGGIWTRLVDNVILLFN
ncbi:MAG: D-alanyl-D-alanine carboxypeptidase family protein [Thiohalospira sp.]